MEKRIKVVIKDPGKVPREEMIRNKLDALQAAVGGYIETVTYNSEVVIICNEEGRLIGLEPNCTIAGMQFVGPIILAGVNGSEFADFPYPLTSVMAMFPQMWGLDYEER